MLDRYIDHGDGTLTPGLAPMLFGTAAIFILVCLRWPMTLALAGVGAAAFGLLWAVNYTRHHTKWLVLALLLNEALSSVDLIDDSLRPIIRYSMLALFCVPYVSTAIKTGLLKKGGFKLYLIYFIWAGITVTYSIYPFYSFGRVSSAALLLTSVVAITASIEDDAGIYDLVRIFWIGSLITMAAAAFALVALPSDMTWKPDENGMLRFAGLYNGPNQIGELVLTTVASALIYWPAAPKRTRYLISASIVIAIIFDIMADSRSPFIALSVGLVLLATRKYGVRAIAVAAVLLVTVLVVLPRLEGGRDYVMRGDVSSLTGRTEIWNFAVQAVKERPVLGHGYEVEGEIFQSRYFPLWEDIWDAGPKSSLHNGYLSRAVGVGIPATLLWAFLVTRALGFTFFNRGASQVLKNSIMIGAVPVLILNLVESTAGDCRYNVGLLLALIWALSEKARLASRSSNSMDSDSSLDFAGRLQRARRSLMPIKPRLEAL